MKNNDTNDEVSDTTGGATPKKCLANKNCLSFQSTVMDNLLEPVVTKRIPTRDVVHMALQLLALGFLIAFCFNILLPFINPILWGAILAVALYPLQQRVKKSLKGRGTLAAVLITIILLVLIVLPGTWLAIKTAGEIKEVTTAYRAGDITIPPPTEKVKGWPLIGYKVHEIWLQASNDLESLVQEHPDQVKAIAATGIGLLAGTGKSLLLIAVATIISGVFLSYADKGVVFAKALFERLLNSKKFDMADIAAVTIRNVVRGILGVALIQSSLALAGFIVADIPYAGVWFFLCLILAIIQIGILPVSIGVIIYIWSNGDNLTATLLTIWMLAVGLLDNILKPVLMGKGAPVPMLIIFLGALGGFMFSGIIGLFTGAVVLSLGYRLFDVWLKGTEI